ncbi:MAG: hypothetical protein WD534_12885 [Phycisphaeraceae bacterium]
MDKKAKKRIQLLKDKLQNRRRQLASAKKQPDDAGEVERLQQDIARIENELQQLQSS